MKNNRAVSMISLVITIVIMIIIAAISATLFSQAIDDSQYEDARVEVKNVENVVENVKSKILADEFVPNPDYIISNADLDSKFGNILTDDEIAWIKEVNDSDRNSAYKYYLMTQERFNSELRTDFNVSNIRNREYLVNYMDNVVVLRYDTWYDKNKTRFANGDTDALKKSMRISNAIGGTIMENKPIERGRVSVTFVPNGSPIWKDKQIVSANVSGDTVSSITYLWTQSYTEPELSEFSGDRSSSYSSGTPITLTGVTGNNWYFWLKVEYLENGALHTAYFRSNPFFLDNDEPTAILEVDEITK